MNWKETRFLAETKRFTLEIQTWYPDDGPLQRAFKVTFPPDYPRPAGWITFHDGETIQDRTRALQRMIDEYDNREAIFRQNIETSERNVNAMAAFAARFL